MHSSYTILSISSPVTPTLTWLPAASRTSRAIYRVRGGGMEKYFAGFSHSFDGFRSLDFDGKAVLGLLACGATLSYAHEG